MAAKTFVHSAASALRTTTVTVVGLSPAREATVTNPSAASSIRSKVRYSKKPGGEELWLKVADNSTNIEWVNVPVDIEDARPLIGRTSLDREGFEIHVAESKVPSWDDEEAVKSIYYPEAVDLVKKGTGAKHAWVFDHTFRRVDNSKPGRPFARDPVSGVHLDYSSVSAVKRLEDFFGKQVAEKSGRFAIINVWRPVVDVVYDKPLGFIDATSLEEGDLSVYKLILEDRIGENQTVHPNEGKHKWYYLQRQLRDEVYLFKQFDSDTTKTQWSPHTGFTDPTAPPDGTFQPRESIELRAFVFYDMDEDSIEALHGTP